MINPTEGYLMSEESFFDLAKDAMILSFDHWKEVMGESLDEFRLDFKQYASLHDGNHMKTYVMRDLEFNDIVGYANFLITTGLHSSETKIAGQDFIYIVPRLRGKTNFLEWCDFSLKKDGVNKVFHHVSMKKDFSKTLESLGYELFEKVYMRRL